MMKPLIMMPVVLWLTGCAAAIPAIPALSGLIPSQAGTQVLTTTTVDLSKQNYKIVKANATASSVGFSLLGIFTFKAPSYEEAITNLYRSAGIAEGRSQAIVNVVHEHSSTFFILFALPKISVRADVIEFTDGATSAQGQDVESSIKQESGKSPSRNRTKR